MKWETFITYTLGDENSIEAHKDYLEAGTLPDPFQSLDTDREIRIQEEIENLLRIWKEDRDWTEENKNYEASPLIKDARLEYLRTKPPFFLSNKAKDDFKRKLLYKYAKAVIIRIENEQAEMGRAERRAKMTVAERAMEDERKLYNARVLSGEDANRPPPYRPRYGM